LCNSCASFAGLVLCFIACFISLVIAPLVIDCCSCLADTSRRDVLFHSLFVIFHEVNDLPNLHGTARFSGVSWFHVIRQIPRCTKAEEASPLERFFYCERYTSACRGRHIVRIIRAQIEIQCKEFTLRTDLYRGGA